MSPWLPRATAIHSYNNGGQGLATHLVQRMVHTARDTTHTLRITPQTTPEAQLTSRVLTQERKGQAYFLRPVPRGQQWLPQDRKRPLFHPIRPVESRID